ncbi:sucrase ferredoxin [Granulicoccus sp. GXG6511]|uniref:sucrase ferredoxin n=1 Tax=Granulicoccus sp. GXG6511 TaxID=3381351 RepID=UPI003D7DD45B
MNKPQFRCSDDARERGDRYVGTAPPAKQWFLVEQTGNWGASAWEGLDLEHDEKETLEELLEDAGARLMLIRRPAVETHADAARPSDSSGTAHGTRRWCVIRTADGAQPQVVWGSAANTAELVAAAQLFAEPTSEVPGIDAADADGSGSGTTATNEPEILLVCTHGRKDVCCAVRGRPVAATAARLWPVATWECTHTGGDRFAGNLIVLPDGACYGGLDPEDVEPVVTAHVAGRVDPAHLRGPSGYPNHVQAAMVEAYARFAPLAFDAVRPVSATGSPDAWTVRLAVRGVGEVEVAGHTQTTAPEFLTCKADIRKVMRLPIVDTVQVTAEA